MGVEAVNGRPAGVLLDALGTLVELEPPWPRLIESLRARYRIEVGWDEAKQAMLAEMSYYKRHHDEGRDADSLAELRLRCARQLSERLQQIAEIPGEQLVELLLDSLRFAPYPDVPGALADLRRLGLRLAIVSNWDCSLPATLAGLGLEGLVDAVVVSADVGARKPEPAIFEAALERLDVPARAALMVGDSPETDMAGAAAAGIEAVLLDRSGRLGESTQVPRISNMTELAGLIAARLA